MLWALKKNKRKGNREWWWEIIPDKEVRKDLSYLDPIRKGPRSCAKHWEHKASVSHFFCSQPIENPACRWQEWHFSITKQCSTPEKVRHATSSSGWQGAWGGGRASLELPSLCSQRWRELIALPLRIAVHTEKPHSSTSDDWESCQKHEARLGPWCACHPPLCLRNSLWSWWRWVGRT